MVVTKFNVVVAPDAAVVSVKLATVGVVTRLKMHLHQPLGHMYQRRLHQHLAPLVTAAKPVGITKLNVAAVADEYGS